jgi:hypothetical protein
VRLAAMSFMLTLLVVVTGESPHLGINLFTAVALSAGATAAMLFRTIGKLA